MDILERIFNSPAQVKVMRLFLYNSDAIFDAAEVKKRTQLSSRAVSKEAHRLLASGFLRQRSGFIPLREEISFGKNKRRKRVQGWILNPRFSYLEQMKDLLVGCHEVERIAIAKKFAKAGRIKLLVISGVFLRSDFSRVDILLVGDHLRHAVITQALKSIESSLGKDVRYAVFETKDFLYRLSVYDKFVRDILDYPHEKLVDRFGLR